MVDEENKEVEGKEEEKPKLFSGGEGTSDSPFLVSTPEDLNNVRKFPDSHFRQINPINMRGIVFSPIGEFRGVYSGDGFCINGLDVAVEYYKGDAYMSGMFDYVEGVVRDVRLVNVRNGNLVGALEGLMEWCSAQRYDKEYCGVLINSSGLVNSLWGGEINCCFVDGVSIKAVTDEWWISVGGLISSGSGRIKDCYSRNVNIMSSDKCYSGGFIGLLESEGFIENCYSDNVVMGAGGGFVGGAGSNTVIKECFSSNAIINSKEVETLGGFIAHTTVPR